MSADDLLKGEPYFRRLADFVPQLMWLANPDGWIYWYNKKWYDYTGTTPEQMEGWGWQAIPDPHVLPEVLDEWMRSVATGEPFDMVFPLKAANGEFRAFLTRSVPLKDGEGKVLRWFGTNTDISEQKLAEDNLKLLLDELNHRVKNTLASVQAIATQSFKSAPQEESDAFHERLSALTKAHDMLARGNWQPSDFRRIVTQSVARLCASDGTKIKIDGPAILVPPNRVPGWSLALHELAMNAQEHGALKTPGGAVEIAWRLLKDDKLRFSWREQAELPLALPGQRGFGLRLIENFARELAGHASVSSAPDGWTCVIEAPLNPQPGE